MTITKKISESNELYVYMNGELIYKRWLNTGQSKVFDVMAYDKYTYASYTDLDIKDSPHLIHVKARIRLKTSDEGGRSTGIASGYRPDHVFGYAENGKFQNAFIGDIQFEGNGLLELGKEQEVTVRFLLHQRMDKFLNIGRKWWIHEGPVLIGEAEILEFEIPSKEE